MQDKKNSSFIPRDISEPLKKLFQQYPIVTVIGARQTGKSTLVRHTFPDMLYVNLEAPDIRLFAENDPRGFLEQYPDKVILDEIQNVPNLLSYIQVKVDEKNHNGQFILTGSHQLALHEFISQSLAGRTAICELLPLSITELAKTNVDLSVDQYLFQGFFPRIYKEKLDPTSMYRDYVKTYVERDVRKLVNVKDLSLFQKFLKLSASRVGQIFNSHHMSNEIGVSHHTIHSWLSILEASYLVMRLQPYYENFGKRIIKSPKLYFTDVGLATYLLDIHHIDQIKRDPLRGQLVENMMVMELFKAQFNRHSSANYYFYRDHLGNEVDLIYKKANQLIPIEIKAAQTFTMQFLKSIHYFKKLVGERCPYGYVIYTGQQEQ
ncbi:MAG: ATP-binding protein, partial [Gammaproteobacteria bacterium]|nr:ATP-binding protein [Gammaproteobacteria bacterium]